MADDLTSKGRKANDAQDLGDRHGLVSDHERKKTAERSKKSAGPDGPDARETFPGTPP